MFDPHATHGTSPVSLFRGLWTHRQLIFQLARREVAGRYRGSLIGLGWSFFVPVLMLLVYTFVFSVVFGAKWSSGPMDSRANFAIAIFVGLIVHGLFAECINRAPTIVLQNASYVKKVVFPLEILPWVVMGSALFHAGTSVFVLLCAQLLLGNAVPWTIVLLPLIFIPLILFTIGLSWFLGAMGVYLRDIGQATGLVTSVAMFLSPVFYPVSAVPEKFRLLLKFNPLTPIIEQSRGALIAGEAPDPGAVAIALAAGMIVAWAGYWWFQRARKGFADVI